MSLTRWTGPSTSGALRLTLRTSDPSFMLSPSTAPRTGVAEAKSQHATLRTGDAKTNPPAGPWKRAAHALGRALRSFMADRRGAAALETALGTVVMITATALFFDVYNLAATQHTLLHDAISIGDYVSRDEQVSATHIKDLAEFLYTENHSPLNASFSVSAFRAESSAKVNLLWTENATFGTASTALTTCAQVPTTPPITPPNGLTLKAGETAIVAKVCVEQDDESVLHASYLIQSRADNPPQLQRDA